MSAPVREVKKIVGDIDAIKRHGWRVTFGGEYVVLHPNESIIARYGFSRDAHFTFTSLDSAAGWAKGFDDCAQFARVRADSLRAKLRASKSRDNKKRK